MRHPYDARQAWKLWNLLTEVTDRLWEFYEQEFFEFYAEDEDDDWLKIDDDP